MLTSPQPLEKLNVLRLSGVQMRTFHLTWLSFFVCFFGWFGLAPLMPSIREDLGLTKGQIGNLIIASVSATVLARLIIGRLCDVWGPRLTYTGLLVFGSLPVFLVGLANSYETFLLFRLAISVIGASFVVTQYHTSMMFAPQIRGTANAVAGGWGNLGGGITNMVMPLVFALIVGLGYTKGEAWRLAMIAPGGLMLLMAWLYYKYTQDTPAGNFADLKQARQAPEPVANPWACLADWRVWALALAYAVCFGMEITFDNVASLYFVDTFGLDQTTAGFWAGVFGFMNIFARAMGGIAADRVGRMYGIKGKGWLLAGMLLLEGTALIWFAQSGHLGLAVAAMLSFALFLKMANGATYAIVPFINPRQLGVVSGVVGAGGNLGGMLFGFLFKAEGMTYADAFLYIGMIAISIAALVMVTKFDTTTPQAEPLPQAVPQPVAVPVVGPPAA
jgi:NNP family nitrate/nitrite transporter-like MFS transporter